jgi:hypothetical protein
VAFLNVFWVERGIVVAADSIEHTSGMRLPTGSQGVRGTNPLSSTRESEVQSLAMAGFNAYRRERPTELAAHQVDLYVVFLVGGDVRSRPGVPSRYPLARRHSGSPRLLG